MPFHRVARHSVADAVAAFEADGQEPVAVFKDGSSYFVIFTRRAGVVQEVMPGVFMFVPAFAAKRPDFPDEWTPTPERPFEPADVPPKVL